VPPTDRSAVRRGATEFSLANWLALAFSQATDPRRVALGFVNICDLKMLNATAGMSAGDAAMRAVEDHLVTACADRALIVRVGGSEFAVAAPASALELHAALDALPRTFSFHGRTLTLERGLGTAAVDDLSEAAWLAAESATLDMSEADQRSQRTAYDGIRARQEAVRARWAAELG
jgi:GGDEF domain-containing protein